MPHPPRGFDRLAHLYAGLERLTFGHRLALARRCFLTDLANVASVLVVGEGDGRFLRALLEVNRCARVDCIDSSRMMLARASARLTDETRARVRFIHTDARSFTPTGRYDAVVTLFFSTLAKLAGASLSRAERGRHWGFDGSGVVGFGFGDVGRVRNATQPTPLGSWA